MSAEAREILLCAEEPTVLDRLTGFRPTELVIYLDQHVREIGPRVVLDRLPGNRARLHLLPAEARRVSEALTEMADLAEASMSS